MKFNFWKILFFLLPAVYFFAFGRWGFSDTDSGFIPGLAWRIVSGQVPYQDFIYVRPPITLYLHALVQIVLRDAWETIAERILFYLLMAASTGLLLFAVRKLFEKYLPEINIWMVACGSFIISVHNFPPLPWHTVDAIFFAALGCWLLSPFSGLKISTFIAAAGFLFLCASALCKQPFAILVPASFLYGWSQEDRKKMIQGFGICLGFFATLFLFLVVFHPGWISAMLNNILGETKFIDLLHAGIISYWKGIFVAAPAIALFLLLRMGETNSNRVSLLEILIPLNFLFLIFANVLSTFSKEEFIGPSLGYSQGLWISGVMGATFLLLKNKNEGLFLFLLLMVSWCAGISWGYETPVLASAPAIAGTLFLLPHPESWKKYIPAFNLLCFLFFGMMSLFPYRDAPRVSTGKFIEEYKTPGEIFPVMSGTFTGIANYQKLKEFKTIAGSFEDAWVVFPGFTHSHYLMRQIPVFPADWEHNSEIQFTKRKEELELILKTKIKYAMVEKGKDKEIASAEKGGSRITQIIEKQWTKIDSGEFFTIFINPDWVE